MTNASKSDIVRALFAAYKSKDRKAAESLLTENFTFTSPYDDAIDKKTYFEHCWPNIDRIQSHLIERIFEQGDGAFATYKCVTNDEREFRNTEFFAFDGDRIREVNVYFGAEYRNGVFARKQ